jgi:DNA-binding IclR family transcriptional regulator
VAHKHLMTLCEKLACTVHLATLDGLLVVYVDKVEPRKGIRLYSEIGKPVRLHASGVGKCILAFASETERSKLLAGYVYTRYTDTTLTSRQSLEQELYKSRARGWAIDDGEHEPILNCLAVPVVDGTGMVKTALSVTALKAQANLQDLQSNLPMINQTARAISHELGWRP